MGFIARLLNQRSHWQSVCEPSRRAAADAGVGVKSASPQPRENGSKGFPSTRGGTQQFSQAVFGETSLILVWVVTSCGPDHLLKSGLGSHCRMIIAVLSVAGGQM